MCCPHLDPDSFFWCVRSAHWCVASTNWKVSAHISFTLQSWVWGTRGRDGLIIKKNYAFLKLAASGAHTCCRGIGVDSTVTPIIMICKLFLLFHLCQRLIIIHRGGGDGGALFSLCSRIRLIQDTMDVSLSKKNKNARGPNIVLALHLESSSF